MGTRWDDTAAFWLCLSLLVIVETHGTSLDGVFGADRKKQSPVSTNGACKCEPCQTGPNCSESILDYAPRFGQRYQMVEISEEAHKYYRKPITYNNTAYPGGPGCSCPVFEYTITEVENVIEPNDNKNVFTINRTTGEIRLAEDRGAYELYKVTVAVRNTRTDAVDEAKLTVAVRNKAIPNDFYPIDQNGYSQGLEHHIVKRAIPTEVGLSGTQTTAAGNVKIGKRVEFSVQVEIPAAGTDLTVELFAPGDANTLMILCSVNPTLGNNLGSASPGTPVYNSKVSDPLKVGNSFTVCDVICEKPDWVVMNFGAVTNSGASSVAADSTIDIYFEAILIDEPTAVSGDYWVSAGVECDSSEKIFILQFCQTVVIDNDYSVADVASFQIAGPSTMALGDAVVYDIDMFMPHPHIDYIFKAFTPLDTVGAASVCAVSFVDYADAFTCGNDQTAVTTQLDHCLQGPGNYQGTVTTPKWYNKMTRDAVTDINNNRITNTLMLHVLPDDTLVGTDITLALAVEVGTTQMWIGNHTVTVAPAPTTGLPTPIIAVTTTSLTSWQASLDEPFSVRFEVTIPVANAALVEVEVIAPIIGTPVFQVCKLAVVTRGANFPCLLLDDLTTEYTGGDTPEKATIKLGSIKNMALGGPSADDVIEFEAILTPLSSHASATLSSSHDVTFGVTVGDAPPVVSVLTASVILQNPLSLAVITNSTPPVVSLAYDDLNADLPVGGHTQVDVEISLPADMQLPTLDLEYLMPYDDTESLAHICRVEVVSTGKNVPCVTPEWADAVTQNFSQRSDGIVDRATASLGPVCNKQFVANTEEDKIKIRVFLQVLWAASLTDGTQLWVQTLGVGYDTNKLLVAQLSALVKTRASLTFSPTKTIYTNFEQVATLDPVPVNYFVKFKVLIKIPSGDKFDLKVKASTVNTGLDICSVRPVQTGNNLPCLVHETAKYTPTPHPSGGNAEILAEFGVVRNFGSLANGTVVPNNIFDDDSVSVEVIGIVTAAGGSYDVTVDVIKDTVDSDKESTTFSFTTTADQASIDTTIPVDVSTTVSGGYLDVNSNTGLMVVADDDVGGSNITFGQAKPVMVRAVIPEGSMYQMEVDVIVPSAYYGKVELSDAAIYSVGDNLPCVDTAITPTFTSAIGINVSAKFSLGYVCSSPLKAGNVQANTIEFVGYVRLLDNGLLDPVAVPTITLVASVKVFSVITQTSMDLTVISKTDFLDRTPGDPANVTLVAIQDVGTTMAIGENRTFTGTVTVPAASSSRLMVDVKTPNDGTSVCITASAIRSLGAKGRNVIGADAEGNVQGVAYIVQCNSTYISSQQDYCYVDFGIVTNTAITQLAQFSGTAVVDDDQLDVEFDLQMADCDTSVTNGAVLQTSFGAKVADQIGILNHDVTVVRSNSETPDLAFDVVVGASSTSTQVILEGTVYHNLASSAELFNTSIQIAAPAYLNFQASIGTTSPQAHTVNVYKPDILEITMTNRFYFTDVFEFTATLDVNSAVVLPDGYTSADTGIYSWVVGNHRTTPGDVVMGQGVTFWPTDAGSGSSCDSPLGMEANTIQDCQISGAKGQGTNGNPNNGRKGGSSAWSPPTRNGAAFGRNRYFTVYFGREVKVTQMGVQQDTGSPHMATELEVDYSNDGISFHSAETVDLGASPGTYELVSLMQKVETYYIRAKVTQDTSNNNRPVVGIKFEFFGCEISNTIPPADICTNAAAAFTAEPTAADFYRRSFVTDDNGCGYVCDRKPDSMDHEGQCTMSCDCGTSWTDLPTSLSAMIGYESSKGKVYAYGQNLEVMDTEDIGVTWLTTDPNELADSQSLATWRSAVDCPEIVDSLFDRQYPYATYSQNSWGCTYNGMSCGNSQKTNWTVV